VVSGDAIAKLPESYLVANDIGRTPHKGTSVKLVSTKKNPIRGYQ